MKPPPMELILRAQRGDPGAVAEILREGRSLARFVAWKHRGVDFEDAQQIAYLGFLLALGRWRPRGGAKFWSFLAMFAHGYIAWEARKNGLRASRLALFDEMPDASDELAALDAIEDGIASGQVLRLVDAMPARERCVALGRFAHEHTLDDVSDVVGVSRERVRQMEPDVMRKLRARAKRGALD